MLKNIFKIGLRNILKNKLFSAINIFGLSIGISAFLLLFLYVNNEITYDRFHKHFPRVCRVLENQMEYTRGLTAPYILENFPEVENATRVLDWAEKYLEYGEKGFVQNISYVDTGFFSMFSFQFLEGNPEFAFADKYSIVLTKDVAQKYFGSEPALDKQLLIAEGNHLLKVTGVVDIPNNSTIQFNAVTSYETGLTLDPWLTGIHDWYNTFSQSYVLLKKGTDLAALEDKFILFVEEKFLTGEQVKPTLNLLPLQKLHNHVTSNKSFTYILICIAFGIILIASVNFINLFTVLSYSRYNEIGMRKTLGARRIQLNKQFLGESITISMFAVGLGVVFTFLLLPVYNKMFETSLQLNVLSQPYLFVTIILLWVLSGILSGLIPAINLSKLPVLSSLKGNIFIGKKGDIRKNILVSLQFAIAIFLMMGSFTIIKQIRFMQNHALNFDAENVVIIRSDLDYKLDKEALSRKFNVILNELKDDPRVISATISAQVPGTYIENYNMFYTNGWSGNDEIRLRQVDIGPNYFKTYGIKFLEGDPRDEENIFEENAVVINETAFKKLEATTAVNNHLYGSSRNGEPYKIIGVVEDFHYQGLHKEIQPLIHFYRKNIDEYEGNYMSVRVKPGQMIPMLAHLKEKWKTVQPVSQFDYFFANDEINKQYKFVIQTSSLVAYFSALAIILSCLGLLAMIIHLTSRKLKEIGVRKVNGAKIFEILTLLNLDFVKWVTIAFVLACPIAWYAMNKWLENFAYKTQISWWIYALAGVIALIIAVVTVSWQSWRAASRNPVEALRYE